MKALIRMIAGAGMACAVLCAHASAPAGQSVRDNAEVLDVGVVATLERKIEQIEAAGGPPVAVLTVASLKGEDPDAFFMRQAEAWGHPGDSRGVLIGVATAEHKIRLEVSHSLADALPPEAAQAIAHDVMAPRLRAGDYAGGIAAALDAVEARTTQSTAISEAAVPSKGATLPPAQSVSAQARPSGLETVSDSLQNIIGVLLPIVGLIAAVCIVFRKVYGDDTPSYTSSTYRSSSTSSRAARAVSSSASRPRDDDDVLRTAATVYAVDRMTRTTSRDDSPSPSRDDSSGGGSGWSSDYSSSSSSSDYSSSGSDY